MTNPEPVTLPRPVIDAEAHVLSAVGSPTDIEQHAVALMAAIQAGSIDEESFAANAIMALDAMGIPIQPAYLPMVASMLGSGYSPPA